MSDDCVIKAALSEVDSGELQTLLNSLGSTELYDVVMDAPYGYEALETIKIRYLCCYNCDEGKKVKINLKFPETLISASFDSVSLANINCCVNLINFCSFSGLFETEIHLKCLKRF